MSSLADLWGRLSNPSGTLELAPEQRFLVEPATVRRPQKATGRPSTRPVADDPNNTGRHSNPGSGALRGDVDGVDSPTAGGAGQRPTKPVQRRLTPTEIVTVGAKYRQGRSLDDLARKFGVHRRTVADHLERLGVARRVNLLKLTQADIERAISQYQAGDSLATVGKILNVGASTVQRALKRAGVAIRPRPGRGPICHLTSRRDSDEG